MANTPPNGLMRLCQISTVAVPESMPAIAPYLLVRRQYSEVSISGPKEAPSPAHAYDTTWKMEEFWSKATTIPKMNMTNSVIRATIITCRSVALRCSNPWKMFSATAEAPMIIYDEDELMDAAKMPDTTMPHIKLGSNACETTMKMFSAADWVANWVGIMARPTRPMHTPQASETTHQVVAMMRDFLISSELRMDRKRTSTCGMPKYPSPHASMEMMVMMP